MSKGNTPLSSEYTPQGAQKGPDPRWDIEEQHGFAGMLPSVGGIGGPVEAPTH
jgi:hypothetical protein